MRRSFGLATTFAIAISALLAPLFPTAATATPGDTTIYPVICASTGRVSVHLEYGVDSITVTNPNACGGAQSFYFSNGSSSTWIYSETIGGVTTVRSFVPGSFFETGAIGIVGGIADSFTLNLTSASSNTVTMSGGGITLDVYFNKEFGTLNPDPVAIGEQVTVTGSSLSTVTSLEFSDGIKYFSATTANRTATQLTFTVPSTIFDEDTGITSNVIPGTYRLRWLQGTNLTLTVTAAPVVASISNEELARQASAKREIEKRSAREVISSDFKNFSDTKLEIFIQAEIAGITAQNVEVVHAEITALPAHSSGDISGILKIARKYEVVGIIASERVTSIYSDNLIEIGLIPTESKNKAALMAAIKKLPVIERSSYATIKEAINNEMAEIQARKDRTATVLARVASRNG